jgi:acyl-CoA thioesterase FadM
VSLYFRLFWVWLRALSKPVINLGDVIELNLHVLPNDLDLNGHMNNGRYLTIVDLALVEYFIRSGFAKAALQRRWRPVLGGSIISYRRSLQPFAAFTIRFSVTCWDERWSYMSFVFLQHGKTMAIGHTKGAVMSGDGFVSSVDSLAALGISLPSPQFPPSISSWVEAERLIVQ